MSTCAAQAHPESHLGFLALKDLEACEGDLQLLIFVQHEHLPYACTMTYDPEPPCYGFSAGLSAGDTVQQDLGGCWQAEVHAVLHAQLYSSGVQHQALQKGQ